MLRYVLLRHECPPAYQKPSHWDFMIEQGGVLLTWEVRELPKPWGEVLGLAASDEATVQAVRLADHRLAYLEYEGEISGDRGTVTRCDRGSYQLVSQDDAGLEINLSGGELCGVVTLFCDGSDWQLSVGSSR